MGRAKKKKVIKKDINYKDVNKNKKHDMQWIFKKIIYLKELYFVLK